jgi:hypothetical protein
MMYQLSMKKHAQSGHTVNNNHFTGVSSKQGTPRKQKLTMRQKRAKRGIHVNKYADLTTK